MVLAVVGLLTAMPAPKAEPFFDGPGDLADADLGNDSLLWVVVRTAAPRNIDPLGICLRVKKIVYAFVPLAFAIALVLVGELFCRAQRGSLFSSESARVRRLVQVRALWPADYDSILGYVPSKS